MHIFLYLAKGCIVHAGKKKQFEVEILGFSFFGTFYDNSQYVVQLIDLVQ